MKTQAKRSQVRHLRPAPPGKSATPMALLSQARLLHAVVLEKLLRAEGIEKLVKPGMGPALFAMFEEDGMLAKSLVARTGMAASTVTELVQRMEKSGLVRRVRDAADSRAVRLHLTAQGHAVKPHVLKVARQFEKIIQRGLSPADVTRLASLLRHVIGNWQAHLQKTAEQSLVL